MEMTLMYEICSNEKIKSTQNSANFVYSSDQDQLSSRLLPGNLKRKIHKNKNLSLLSPGRILGLSFL